jgi:hypothetical protein
MALIPDTPTRWTCVDYSLHDRYTPKETESAGLINRTDDAGYFTTHNPEVAKELKERYPMMLVQEHEEPTGGQALRTVNFTITKLPGSGWMTDDERKAARKRGMSGVEPESVQ